MKGPRFSPVRGFTLPELLVTVLIGMAVMGGIAVMFGKLSEWLNYSQGLHARLQVSEKFREDYEKLVSTFPYPIAQSGSSFDIAEFGFEAVAFTNATGNGGFVAGALRNGGTGVVIWNSVPYAEYHPVLLPLTAADVNSIRTSWIAAYLAGTDSSKWSVYRDMPISRLIVTDVPDSPGAVRLDVSFLATYSESASGKTFALAKSEDGIEAYPITIQSATPVSWDSKGCFASTQTHNGHQYSIPAVANGGVVSADSQVAVTDGFRTYRQSFTCTNGILAASATETDMGTTCTKNCVAAEAAASSGSTRTASCVGIPSGAVWNWTSSITQAFDGTAWNPTATGSYNETLSMTECRFKCENDRTWSGWLCWADCPVPASDTHSSRSYGLSSSGTVYHGQTGQGRSGTSFFGTSPANGSLTANFSYSCSNGSLTKTSSNGTSVCPTNYTFNDNWTSPVCVANTRTFTCAAKPATGTVWNTVSSYLQTWNGTAWAPVDSTTAYNTAGSTASCRYACDSGYGWNGSVCGVTVNGACGTAHGALFASAPTSDLCASGTASSATPSGTGTGWVWTCAGDYAGTNANCSASATAFTFNYVVSSNTMNFNVRNRAIAAGWNQILPLVATITVNAGVVIGSASTAAYAFDTDSGFPAGSSLTLTNNGYIVGAGGGGGKGGDATACGGCGFGGGNGGPALRAAAYVTIANYGTIGWGGGWGGGMGGGYFSSSYNYTYGWAGGGGGGGYSPGGGGAVAGQSQAGVTPGTAGTLTGGGAGGCGNAYGCAGAGGGLGSAGAPGPATIINQLPGGGAGGAWGDAVNGNSYVSWTAIGSRYGNIN